MSDIVPKKMCYWGNFAAHLFQKKSADEAHRDLAGTHFLYVRTCRDWFRHFKNDFDDKDKERSGAPKNSKSKN